MRKTVWSCCLIFLIYYQSFAQQNGDNARIDDHLVRRKIVMRIDLTEKINQPLIYCENPSYYDHFQDFESRCGIVNAILQGYQATKYVAYQANTPEKALQINDFMKSIKSIEASMADDKPESSDFESDDTEVSSTGLDFEDEFGFFEDDSEHVDEKEVSKSESKQSILGLNTVLEIIEDRIFDKNKSTVTYKPLYFRIVWVDPYHKLPEKLLAAFRISDIGYVVSSTQWKNRFNDAGDLSIQQILEIRLFHGYIISISGGEVKTLDESEKRSHELVKFEHNLWEY